MDKFFQSREIQMNNIFRRFVIAGGLLLLTGWMVACTLSAVQPGATPGPITDADIPAALQQQRALAEELQMDVAAVEIVSVEAVTWSDSCLGLGGPAESCAVVETPGYRVTLAVDGEQYVYHTDADGSQARLAPSPEAGAAPDAPTACLQPGDGEQLLVNVEHGYCVLYPATHTTEQTNPDGMEIVVDSVMNHIDPRASITVEAANGRTLDAVIDEALADYVPEGFDVAQSAITVDGVDAVLLDNLPGQDLNRRVLFLHGDRLYSLFFAPIGEAESDTREQADALYDLVLDSFRFLSEETAISEAMLAQLQADGAATANTDVQVQAVADGYARVVIYLDTAAAPDNWFLGFAREGDAGWESVTYGSGMDELAIEEMGVPRSVWPDGWLEQVASPSFGWPVYGNDAGAFAIMYPPDATVHENERPSVDGVLAPAENTLSIVPASGDYALIITYSPLAEETELAEFVDAQSACAMVSGAEGEAVSLGGKDALRYVDVPCGPRGTSYWYTTNARMGYQLVVEYDGDYAAAADAVETVLATFQPIP